MRAIVWTHYGGPDSLRLGDVPTPSPGAGEVRIRIHAATVTAGDCEARSFKMPPLFWLPMRLFLGVFRPRNIILGQELAGVIDAVGPGVTRFAIGDEIVAPTDMFFGAYAEYLCVKETLPMVRKPSSMSFAEAATLPVGGLNALHFLRKGALKAGEHLLINGAGGSIGTYGVQIAKAWGAEVTAVDSAPKLEMLRDMGADHVIDYATRDFSEDHACYDMIFDVVGVAPFRASLRALKPGGRLLLPNFEILHPLRAVWASVFTDKRVITGVAEYSDKSLAALVGMVDAGQLKAVIDRRYPLKQIAEAHGFVDTGAKVGNVVIDVASAP